jgi:SAM-dependent methyltransferase
MARRVNFAIEHVPLPPKPVADWENPCDNSAERLLDGHLGGTTSRGDVNTWYPELWDWLVATFGAKSAFDVGCGVGYAVRFFRQLGLTADGLDGSPKVIAHAVVPDLIQADLTRGAFLLPEPADLVWCSETAEHVKPRHEDKVVDTAVANCGKVLAWSAAPPGRPGYHHCNCRPTEYWVSRIQREGLVYRPDLTAQSRRLAPVGKWGREAPFWQESGLIFTRT